MSHEQRQGPDFFGAASGAAFGGGAFAGRPLDWHEHDAPPVDEPAEAADHDENVDGDLGLDEV
jgi:hypothetical protein